MLTRYSYFLWRQWKQSIASYLYFCVLAVFYFQSWCNNHHILFNGHYFIVGRLVMMSVSGLDMWPMQCLSSLTRGQYLANFHFEGDALVCRHHFSDKKIYRKIPQHLFPCSLCICLVWDWIPYISKHLKRLSNVPLVNECRRHVIWICRKPKTGFLTSLWIFERSDNLSSVDSQGAQVGCFAIRESAREVGRQSSENHRTPLLSPQTQTSSPPTCYFRGHHVANLVELPFNTVKTVCDSELTGVCLATRISPDVGLLEKKRHAERSIPVLPRCGLPTACGTSRAVKEQGTVSQKYWAPSWAELFLLTLTNMWSSAVN